MTCTHLCLFDPATGATHHSLACARFDPQPLPYVNHMQHYPEHSSNPSSVPHLAGPHQNPHPATTNTMSLELKPTYHGYIADFANLQELLVGIREEKYPLVATKWRQDSEHHPDHIHLAGNTFVWQTPDTTLLDGILWSKGVFIRRRSDKLWELTQSTQIEVLAGEFVEHGWHLAGGQFAQNDAVTREAVPNSWRYYSDLGLLLDKHNLSASHPFRRGRERLVRQRLHYKSVGKELLIASYYFTKDLAQLIRPSTFFRSCFGVIESKEDAERLVELVEELPAEYPLAPGYWLYSRLQEHLLERSNGRILVWPKSVRKPNFVTVPKWSREYPVRERPGMRHFLQLSEAEYRAKNEKARHEMIENKPHIQKWGATSKKSAAAVAIGKRLANNISAYLLPSNEERLLRTRVEVEMSNGNSYLIESFLYDSQWDKLPKITNLYNARFSHGGPSH